VRISNIGEASVKLLQKSYLLAQAVYSTDGSHLFPTSTRAFYVINPMGLNCHSSYFASSAFNPDTWPNTDDFCPTPQYPLQQDWNYEITNGTTPGCFVNTPCYLLQAPLTGQPPSGMYVLFSATTQGGTNPNMLSPSLIGTYVFSLVLSYYYHQYEYQVTIPLLSCYNSGAWCRVSG
jgi:hypothetical protein